MPPQLTLLVATALLLGHPDHAVAQRTVGVFGEGTVTRAGETVFRGQFSPDGSEFWFFRKVRPDAEDYRIFRVRREGSGWSRPDPVHFGGPSDSEMYPTPTPDGRGLVFTSYRPLPGDTSAHPNANLWYVARRGDAWSEPVFMRASTPANYESQPWFDADGGLHFTSTSPDWQHQYTRRVQPGFDPRTASWLEDPLLAPWRDWRRDLEVVHATPSPDGALMVLEIVSIEPSGRRGTSDLWVAARHGTAWSEPVPLGPAVNGPGYEAFAVFTPGGESLLFVRRFEQYLEVPVEEIRVLLRESASGGAPRPPHP